MYSCPCSLSSRRIWRITENYLSVQCHCFITRVQLQLQHVCSLVFVAQVSLLIVVVMYVWDIPLPWMCIHLWICVWHHQHQNQQTSWGEKWRMTLARTGWHWHSDCLNVNVYMCSLCNYHWWRFAMLVAGATCIVIFLVGQLWVLRLCQCIVHCQQNKLHWEDFSQVVKSEVHHLCDHNVRSLQFKRNFQVCSKWGMPDCTALPFSLATNDCSVLLVRTSMQLWAMVFV